MASITIRDLDPSLVERLRRRAARHGRSAAEEARLILRDVLAGVPPEGNLADLAATLFGAEGVELEPHPPVALRAPPRLDA